MVRRPPYRSESQPTSGALTMRVSRLAARMRPMNHSGRPARSPTMGRMGKAMPPARPASSTPGVTASAVRRATRPSSARSVNYVSTSAKKPVRRANDSRVARAS